MRSRSSSAGLEPLDREQGVGIGEVFWPSGEAFQRDREWVFDVTATALA
jgi:hypothetical protein